MLNLFQFINNLLFSKKKNAANRENCSEKLSGFMLNKWSSFYDKQNCRIVGEVCNQNHLTEDPELLSKFLLLFIPRKDYKKINYIKKIKNETEDPQKLICKIMQIGTRDADVILKTVDKENLDTFLKIYKDA